MYRVLIEKVEVVPARGREYQKIADSGNDFDNGAKYGYVEFDSTRTETTKMLEQIVPEVDFAAVVKAINKL